MAVRKPRQVAAKPRRAPAAASTPDVPAAPPVDTSGAAGDAAEEPAPDTAAPPAPPVTKVAIAKPIPVRAGGFVLTKRGWVLDDGRWDT